MGFKKDNNLGNIGDILEKNHTKNSKKPIVLKKKVKETTKSLSDSASSYISEFIERRYSELNED